LELGTGARGQKKLEWCGYWVEQEVWRYLDTIYQRDRRTDRRTPGNSKDRAYA